MSNEFSDSPTTTFADVLGRAQVMNFDIRPLWSGALRVAGPAFTVRCAPGDNLMLHAAIYRAEPGSMLVVESGDLEYAVAGGNVCQVAHRRGVAGLVVEGLIRDLGEVREVGFPVFARGVIPIPGKKEQVQRSVRTVTVGGVRIDPDDVVVADEDGVVVIPHADRVDVLRAAKEKLATEATVSLEDWERAHRARVEKALAEGGVAW